MNIRNTDDVQEILRGNPKVKDLYSIWEARRPRNIRNDLKGPFSAATGAVPWLEDHALSRRFVDAAIGREEFILVLESSREILLDWDSAEEDSRPELVRVRMSYARALTRLGFTKEAHRELESCLDPGFQLANKLMAAILIQLGSVMREEWRWGTDREARIQAAKEALQHHRRAFELDPGRLEALAFCASTAFILRDLGSDWQTQAQESATRILEITGELRNSLGVLRRAVEAEATAHAVLGDLDKALCTFAVLRGLENITTADLAEARFQAGFLAEALGKPQGFFREAFPRLELIVFSGHLPDRPEEPVRFPADLVPMVQDALRNRLDSREARVGLSCASAGADLLFVEALLARGGNLHLVLPWEAQEFRRTSVLPFDPVGEAIWEPRYAKAIESAATIREIGYFYMPGNEEGWEFTMAVTAGIALQTARALRLDVRPIVVWDERPGRGAGGTHSFYRLWKQELGNAPEIISLPNLLSTETAVAYGTGERTERSLLRLEVKTMLFGDLAGYSKLSEKTIPDFIAAFLGSLAELVATSRHAPISIDIWGDAIRAIFDYAHDAGLFALELAEMLVNREDEWIAKGLYSERRHEDGRVERSPLNVRIGLHTGPVAIHFNPVTRKIEFTGAHVIRAARIEPIARPGQVFASEEFAAIVELFGQKDVAGTATAPHEAPGFACEFAGTMKLAKDYPGRHRIYRLVRRRPFAIEALARAAHEDYWEKAQVRGETPEMNPAVRPWDQLSEDIRDANRAQVADIPTELLVVGVELTPSGGMPGSQIAFTPEQVEAIAKSKHERWMNEQKAAGWTWAPIPDTKRKHHPSLVPWAQLPQKQKDKDRDSVKALPTLIEKAGLRVKPII
jgi:class 3 adenylate cyclase/tetratricopeptide (TPR) repeat protein